MSDASDAERAQLIQLRFNQMAAAWAEQNMHSMFDKYITELAEIQKSQQPSRTQQFFHPAPSQPDSPRKKSAFEIALGL